MKDRRMGNPTKLQDGHPVIMKVKDLMTCREAGDGSEECFWCSRLHKVCILED